MKTESMRKAVLLAMFSIAFLAIAGTAQAETFVTLEAVEDAEIDQNWLYADLTLGIPLSTPGDPIDDPATDFRIKEWDNQGTPGEHTEALIKWDLSGLDPGFDIVSVTLQLVITEYGDGVLEVYGIQSGAWAESTVTWNTWAGTSKTLVLLGLMDNSGKTPSAVCEIHDNDNLTAWVQAWDNGTQANNGLVLKWNDASAPEVGDSFYAREDTNNPGPRLVLSDEPWHPYCGDAETVYLPEDLDKNCYVNWGDFAVFASQWLWCTDPADLNCNQYY